MKFNNRFNKFRRHKKNKRFAESFEDFGKCSINKNFKSCSNSLPDIILSVEEDEKYYHYSFFSPGLKKSCLGISYSDKYITIERNKDIKEKKLVLGKKRKDKLKRISSKSFFIKENVKEDFDYVFRGDHLIISFKKN